MFPHFNEEILLPNATCQALTHWKTHEDIGITYFSLILSPCHSGMTSGSSSKTTPLSCTNFADAFRTLIFSFHTYTSSLTMPPKKAVEEVKSNVVAFGRVRKNLKMGCVGLPNVGKSSLFNLLTEQSAAAESECFIHIGI